MRCMNCGLPLSPARALSNCPRCGSALNTAQGVGQQQSFEQAGWGGMGQQQQSFEQAGWGGMGATPPPYNPWGQEVAPNSNQPFYQQASTSNQLPFATLPRQSSELPVPGSMRSSGLQQTPFPPNRAVKPVLRKSNTGMKVALVGLIVATLLLGVVATLGFLHLGKSAPNSANANPTSSAQQTAVSPTATSAPSSTATVSPSVTPTAYPGQQYIDGAQMMAGTSPTTLQPATSFTVGTDMYVTFNIHPPTQGGAFCTIWYSNDKVIVPLTGYAVSPGRHHSYAYANYNNPGPAYVELYWASDTTCADKVLAQHVDFTVTA